MMKIKKSNILSATLSLTSIFITKPAIALSVSCMLLMPHAFAQEVSHTLGVKTASWYGKSFHGRTTANGERFNQDAMTAAHRTLPFGTKLKVTCMQTGKSTIVRINDRGPFHGNRAIDLSKGAAKAIGLIESGTGKVKIDILK